MDCTAAGGCPVLQVFGEGAGNNVALLFWCQGVKANGIARNADSQGRVLLRVGCRVFEHFPGENVDIQVLTAFTGWRLLYFKLQFTRFELAQLFQCNHFILLEGVAFCANQSGFSVRFIDQPDGVYQGAVVAGGNLNTFHCTDSLILKFKQMCRVQ